MIISKNWLHEWIDISNINLETICKKLNSIGLEVDNFSKIVIPKDIVVGQIKSCINHENSDHLHVCEVDIGKQLLQIVCGASNVCEGQWVACAKIGVIMPNGLNIKPSKIRGINSQGMLCSSTELGLPKLNDGIMMLDDSIGELVAGKAICEYDIFCDELIELGLTPNRGDCLSINGVARDLSAAFDIAIKERTLREEEEKLLGIGRILSVHSDEKIRGSFLYRAIELGEELRLNLKILLRLGFIGSLKINPVDKILEYAMHSTGVIFKAYDYEKISTKQEEKISIYIKTENNGSYGIYSNSKCLGQSGIWQTKEASLDENSKFILIEASYVEPEVILTAVGNDKNQPKDETIYRSSRGSEPKLNLGMDFLFDLFALNKKISPYAGAQQIVLEKEQNIVNFNYIELCNMIGANIPRNDVVKILKKLGFDININQEQIYTKVPLYRHDICNSNDICEEIVRMVGIDTIDSKALNFTEQNRINSTYINYLNSKKLRHKSAMAGFIECIHYAFDDPKELSLLGFKPCKAKLLNPINNELSVLKPTLLNHLINSCERNTKNSKKSIKLFEFGDVFDEDGKQISKFAILASGLKNEPSLLNGAKQKQINFFIFADMVQNIIGKFELKKSNKIEFLSKFEQASIYQNGICIGYLGRLHLNLETRRDLFKTYICEINFEKMKFDMVIAKPYSKFPSISRDLSLIVPKDMPYLDIKNCINALNIDVLKEFLPTDIYENKSFEDNISLTLKFVFQDMQKTLEDEEITNIMNKILLALNKKLSIGIR